MTNPTTTQVKEALEHGLWLRNAGSLGPSDRLLADLAYGYQQLVIRLIKAWSELDGLEAQLATHKDTIEAVCTGGRLTCDDCQQAKPCMCEHKP